MTLAPAWERGPGGEGVGARPRNKSQLLKSERGYNTNAGARWCLSRVLTQRRNGAETERSDLERTPVRSPPLEKRGAAGVVASASPSSAVRAASYAKRRNVSKPKVSV